MNGKKRSVGVVTLVKVKRISRCCWDCEMTVVITTICVTIYVTVSVDQRNKQPDRQTDRETDDRLYSCVVGEHRPHTVTHSLVHSYKRNYIIEFVVLCCAVDSLGRRHWSMTRLRHSRSPVMASLRQSTPTSNVARWQYPVTSHLPVATVSPRRCPSVRCTNWSDL